MLVPLPVRPSNTRQEAAHRASTSATAPVTAEDPGRTTCTKGAQGAAGGSGSTMKENCTTRSAEGAQAPRGPPQSAGGLTGWFIPPSPGGAPRL